MFFKMRMALIVMLPLISVSPPASAVEGEWVTCPSIGVASRVSPLLVAGRLRCFYWHWTRSEILAERNISSTSGKPFTSCLRSNAGYKEVYASPEEEKNAFFTNRAFCSTTATQDLLNKSAYKWSRWNKELRRVRLGYFIQRQGDLYKFGPNIHLYPCRVKPKEYVFGYTTAASDCVYIHNGTIKSTRDFENLILVSDYGWPVGNPRNNESTIWLDPLSSRDPKLVTRICTTGIYPDAFDPWGIMGTLVGFSAGTKCYSHGRGKIYYNPKDPKGSIAGLE